MTLAPIALCAYKRPEHTRRTVEALAANPEAKDTDLTVFCDAAKNAAAEEGVRATREYARSIQGFASLRVIERERNLGLAGSVVAATTEIVRRHGRVILMEDDLVASPHLLRYFNEGLDLYARDERVWSLHAYVYPVRQSLPETFFLRGWDCWGWATWDRAWRHFEPDGRKLLEELRARKLTREFDFDGMAGYTRMLRNQINGRNDSWAVRAYAKAFLNGGLTLYPGRPLAENIGFDASGTHCRPTDKFDNAMSDGPVRVGGIPVEENREAWLAFKDYFRSIRPTLFSLAGRVCQELARRAGFGRTH